ncbi:PepSY domain-containing protein [Peptococcus simiae]|uniref:PepSY domain-containing protein n=1 Tax=Peptococcus simiae TaxID=1643805 RepID=UPI003981397F
MKKRWIAPVLALALLVTACGNQASQPAQDDDQGSAPAKTEQTNTNKAAQMAEDDIAQAKADKEAAFDKFKDLHADMDLTQFELSYDNGRLVYDLEGEKDGQDVDVVLDANDLSVIKDDLDNDDDATVDPAISKDMLAKIDALVEEAIKDREGSYATGYSLSHDDGRWVLDVETKDQNKQEVEYSYNLETGELIEKDA